jgi:hypothetical protein
LGENISIGDSDLALHGCAFATPEVPIRSAINQLTEVPVARFTSLVCGSGNPTGGSFHVSPGILDGYTGPRGFSGWDEPADRSAGGVPVGPGLVVVESGSRRRPWRRPEDSGSRPISRVLSWATIHLERASPRASSDLPGSLCEPQVPALRPARFPIWSCSRWGLPCRRVLPPTRCALTAPFHPCLPAEADIGGLLSVALSVGSRPPGVTWHLALRSPDFPLQIAQRLPGRLPRRL